MKESRLSGKGKDLKDIDSLVSKRHNSNAFPFWKLATNILFLSPRSSLDLWSLPIMEPPDFLLPHDLFDNFSDLP
jgi:hypothetical protein